MGQKYVYNPLTCEYDIIDEGAPGLPGPRGPIGASGAGVPSGGTTGQVLSKASDDDRDTEWTNPGSTPSLQDVVNISGTVFDAAIEFQTTIDSTRAWLQSSSLTIEDGNQQTSINVGSISFIDSGVFTTFFAEPGSTNSQLYLPRTTYPTETIATREWVQDNAGGGTPSLQDVVNVSGAVEDSSISFYSTSGSEFASLQSSSLTLGDGADQTEVRVDAFIVKRNNWQVMINSDSPGGPPYRGTIAFMELDNYTTTTIAGEPGSTGGDLYLPSTTAPETVATREWVRANPNPRVRSIASTMGIAPDIDNYDQFVVTAQAETLLILDPAGTAVAGGKILFAIRDNGTPRTLAWTSSYRGIGVTLPTTTAAGKWMYVGAVYNAADSKWDVIAVMEEA